MNFVIDGIQFDPDFVRSKCAYALPYNPDPAHRIDEIFNQNLENNYKLRKSKKLKPKRNIYPKYLIKWKEQKQKHHQLSHSQKEDGKKLKLKVYFKNNKAITNDNNNLNRSVDSIERNLIKTDFFLTELILDNESKVLTEEEGEEEEENIEDYILNHPTLAMQNEQLTKSLNDLMKVNNTNNNKGKDELNTTLNETSWDEHLMNSLSENTARWIVMKNTNDIKRKHKLLKTVEDKHGRYMRNIQDLELVKKQRFAKLLL
jgi:hypothetical protein